MSKVTRTQPSPQAFSAPSNLDPTMSRDVTSRGQRGERERLGTRLTRTIIVCASYSFRGSHFEDFSCKCSVYRVTDTKLTNTSVIDRSLGVGHNALTSPSLLSLSNSFLPGHFCHDITFQEYDTVTPPYPLNTTIDGEGGKV